MRSIPRSSIRASAASSAGRFAWTSVMTATASLGLPFSDTGRLASGWWAVTAHQLVGERAERRTYDRAEHIYPEVAPLARREGRTERARRFHRRAGDRAAEEGVEPPRPADRDRRGGADRAGIGGDGHDHEHQERGQDELVDKGASDSDARNRRAEFAGLVGPDRQQGQRGGGRPGKLGRDVSGRITSGEVATERERERYGRVDVRPGEMPGRVDHHHDDQPEHEAHADRTKRAVVVDVRDYGAAAGEHERERRERLRRGAPAEVRSRGVCAAVPAGLADSRALCRRSRHQSFAMKMMPSVTPVNVTASPASPTSP